MTGTPDALAQEEVMSNPAGGPELSVTVKVADDGSVTVTDNTAGDDSGPRSVVLGRGDTFTVTIHPWDW